MINLLIKLNMSTVNLHNAFDNGRRAILSLLPSSWLPLASGNLYDKLFNLWITLQFAN